MAVSIYQLSYKKLSQIIFEWEAADKASLLALFIFMEVALHWLWFLFVWLRRDALDIYVNMQLLYPMWLGISLVGLFFLWIVEHLSLIKEDNKNLHKWQILLVVVYNLYISIIIIVMGHSSLVAGVSLVGGAMLGMMLIKHHYIWKAFIAQAILILLIIVIPYLGIDLPNFRQLTISSLLVENSSYVTYSEITTVEEVIATSIFKDGVLSWDNVDELRRSSAFFWRSTHIYLALPKAIFMVYVLRTLLLLLENSKAEILQYANQDELTQLYNRRYALERMQQTLTTTTYSHDYSVILLDLDSFKEINDTYGHEGGDQVLREVAAVLTATLTEKDIISRYGGEEFLIAMPDTNHDEAKLIAEQLRGNIAQHVVQVADTVSLQVTASLGLHTLTYNELTYIREVHLSQKSPVSTSNPTKLQRIKLRGRSQTDQIASDTASAQLPSDICQCLISKADKALYKAKHRGRNQMVSFNDLSAKDSSAKESTNPAVNESFYGT